MKRPDGTRVKGLTPVMQALPHIMPKRYDAMNWANDYLDEDIIKKYIREKRREGHLVTHMSLLIAAYYKAALENPKLNYFVINRKIYKRDYFCVSFVILKTRADGTPDETVVKVYLQPEEEGESAPEFVRFAEGLGITDINVLPHYQQVKDHMLDGLRLFEDVTYADSMGEIFFALVDGSYLLIEDSGEVTLFGEAYCIQDGEIEQISELGDVVQIDPCDEAWEGAAEEEAEWDS